MLPDSVKINWTALKEAFRKSFEISQQARWHQERDLYNLRQHPGQTVASFTADVLQAVGGLQLSEAQKVRVILGGLHSTVTPFVEQSRPQTVDEVLRCPAAVNGMTAPTVLVSDEQIATVASLIEQRLLGQMASADVAHYHGDRTTSRYQQENRDSL